MYTECHVLVFKLFKLHIVVSRDSTEVLCVIEASSQTIKDQSRISFTAVFCLKILRSEVGSPLHILGGILNPASVTSSERLAALINDAT